MIDFVIVKEIGDLKYVMEREDERESNIPSEIIPAESCLPTPKYHPGVPGCILAIMSHGVPKGMVWGTRGKSLTPTEQLIHPSSAGNQLEIVEPEQRKMLRTRNVSGKVN